MLLAFLSIIIIILIIVFFKSINHKRYEKYILLNSIKLKQLAEINSKYSFYKCTNFVFEHIYDNENFFNQIECQDYLIYQIRFKEREFLQQVSKINKNKKDYENYVQELKITNEISAYDLSCKTFKKNKLVQIEQNLYKKRILKPALSFDIIVSLYCSKINGEIYLQKQETFSTEQVSIILKRLNNRSGFYYNDKGIWNAISKVERGNVSNKMRFSIYERDGYRCRKCGATEGQAPLEIDHIIPIAKGGKSTYDNLQTLCHRCNVEKGDSFQSRVHKYY